jgi:hypothetical protein
MPNWVYNGLEVSGSKEDILAFKEKAGREVSLDWAEGAEVRKEDLSFYNFISPTDEELPYYLGHATKPEDERDPNATPEERMAKATTFSGSGWYDWNVRNWGVKWDAGEPSLNNESEISLQYSFETAWGIPEPVFRAMVEQHPTLEFSMSSEEEQGWGAEYETSDTEDEDGKPIKELTLTREWDIPNSHADYEERGNLDGCWCAYNEDEDDWFEDCPRDDKEFFVVVTKTYRVTTANAENAWELAQDNDPDEQMEVIDDETSIVVKDGNGERLYPLPENGLPKPAECAHHFAPVSKAQPDGSLTHLYTECVYCHEHKEGE